MNNIQYNIKKLRATINIAAHDSNRNANHIKCVAVTKHQSIHSIITAIDLKQNDFGENYAQEALKKIHWFKKNIKNKLTWHFIGAVQSNKSRIIAENFDWCHTITSDKLIHRLNIQRPNTLNALNILIQINTNDNKFQYGVHTIDHMLQLAKIIQHYPNLQLRGIMAMSTPKKNFTQQLCQFKKSYLFFKQLKMKYAYVDTLSLGMSDDIIAAIHAGSNLIRIGTGIFGSRTK